MSPQMMFTVLVFIDQSPFKKIPNLLRIRQYTSKLIFSGTEYMDNYVVLLKEAQSLKVGIILPNWMEVNLTDRTGIW